MAQCELVADCRHACTCGGACAPPQGRKKKGRQTSRGEQHEQQVRRARESAAHAARRRFAVFLCPHVNAVSLLLNPAAQPGSLPLSSRGPSCLHRPRRRSATPAERKRASAEGKRRLTCREQGSEASALSARPGRRTGRGAGGQEDPPAAGPRSLCAGRHGAKGSRAPAPNRTLQAGSMPMGHIDHHTSASVRFVPCAIRNRGDDTVCSAPACSVDHLPHSRPSSRPRCWLRHSSQARSA